MAQPSKITILFSAARGDKTTAEIRAELVQIGNWIETQMTAIGITLRYNAKMQAGVSDHWTPALSIEPIEKQ